MTVAVFSDKLFVFDLFSFYRLVSCRVVLVDEVVFCFKILLIIIYVLLPNSLIMLFCDMVMIKVLVIIP